MRVNSCKVCLRSNRAYKLWRLFSNCLQARIPKLTLIVELHYCLPYATWIIGLCLLRIILSNKHRLKKSMSSEEKARKIDNKAMETLRRWRSEDQFNIVHVWKMTSIIGLKIKLLPSNTGFELREARVPRHRPSSKDQYVEGTLESHHRVNTYYPSIRHIKTMAAVDLKNNFSPT